jgi:hypothetical protein
VRRLSSRSTFWYKRVLPFIWLGVLLLIVMSEVSKGRTPMAGILIILACFAFSCVLMKKYFFNLVGEVLDAGDALLIRNGRQEERIALSEIIKAAIRGAAPDLSS